LLYLLCQARIVAGDALLVLYSAGNVMTNLMSECYRTLNVVLVSLVAGPAQCHKPSVTHFERGACKSGSPVDFAGGTIRYQLDKRECGGVVKLHITLTHSLRSSRLAIWCQLLGGGENPKVRRCPICSDPRGGRDRRLHMYQVMGQDIGSMVNNIDTALTAS